MRLPGGTYRFDEVVFDPSNLKLTVAGETRSMEPKSYRLLAFLVGNRGRVVTKEEILQAVWEETAVTDNALTRAVAQIRKALGDDPKEPRFIETVPTVGYRFIGVLKDEAAETSVAGEIPATASARRSRVRMWAGIGAVVVIAAAWIAISVLRQKLPPATVPSAPVPLTTYRGTEEMPSFSPDGNQVAFQWNGPKEGNFDIYVRALGPDSTPLRLTTDPAPDLWPAWSPDGRTIAFQRIRVPDRIELILMPALGGPERKLAEYPYRFPASGLNPAWSANCKWLVVPVLSANSVALFRVSVESGESSRITEPEGTLMDSFPAVSPDGETLLFTRRLIFSEGDLYGLRIGEDVEPVGLPRRIPAGGARFRRALWTAGGQEVLAHNSRGMFRLSAAGSEHPQPLSWLGATVSWVDVSRRGNRIAYSYLQGDANVWRIDLTAKTPRPERLIASTFRDVHPKYSPDGSRIAFYSDRGGSTQVWIGNSDGEQARQITSVKPGQAGTPAWSPDGRMLTVGSNTTGQYQVYTVSPDGGKLKQMTQGPSANFGGSWSRDGRWIYFSSNRTGQYEVWKMPVAGGTASQVTRNGGLKGVESEDGTTLYFIKERGAASIWRMPVSGGSEVQLTTSLYRHNFAVTKQGIYYMTAPGDDGTSALEFYGFASGAVKTILRAGRPEFGLDVSPDGRYLIYAQLDDPASDLMLVENFR